MSNEFNFRFGATTNSDAEYDDHEFTSNDPRKLFRLTYDKTRASFYGTILTSETDDGAFEQEQPMPQTMVDALTKLLPPQKTV